MYSNYVINASNDAETLEPVAVGFTINDCKDQIDGELNKNYKFIEIVYSPSNNKEIDRVIWVNKALERVRSRDLKDSYNADESHLTAEISDESLKESYDALDVYSTYEIKDKNSDKLIKKIHTTSIDPDDESTWFDDEDIIKEYSDDNVIITRYDYDNGLLDYSEVIFPKDEEEESLKESKKDGEVTIKSIKNKFFSDNTPVGHIWKAVDLTDDEMKEIGKYGYETMNDGQKHSYVKLTDKEYKEIFNETIEDTTIDEVEDFIKYTKNKFPGSEAVFDGDKNVITITLDNTVKNDKDYHMEDKVESTNESLNESVSWDYFDKYENIVNKYMPGRGEGDTLASQLVTAINKLIYKWYNDGDVYDNVNSDLSGWANDLSSYANWIYKHIDGSKFILENIYKTKSESDYENILKALADKFLNDEFLSQIESNNKEGSIYECDGPFEFDFEVLDNEYWDPEEEEEDDEYYNFDESLKESYNPKKIFYTTSSQIPLSLRGYFDNVFEFEEEMQDASRKDYLDIINKYSKYNNKFEFYEETEKYCTYKKPYDSTYLTIVDNAGKGLKKSKDVFVVNAHGIRLSLSSQTKNNSGDAAQDLQRDINSSTNQDYLPIINKYIYSAKPIELFKKTQNKTIYKFYDSFGNVGYLNIVENVD